MKDWAEERREVRAFLQPRCRDYEEYQFWDDFFDDLTDMFDGLFDDLFQNDPVLWAHYCEADNSADQNLAFLNHARFLEEAHARGYDVEERL